MAGPGGVEVGRASIRVLPDTSAFGRSLERYVQRIEKSLRIDIPTSADFKGVEDDLNRFRERQQKDPVNIPAKPAQLDEFARQIKAEAERLSKQVELTIPVTADGEQMRRRIAAQVEGLSKLLEVKVPMDVANATAFRAQVLAQLAEVEALAKAADPTVKLRVNVDKSAVRQVEKVGGFLGGLQRLAVSAAGGIDSVFSGIVDGAGSAVKGIAPLIAQIPVIPAALLAAAPLAADLAVSLGPGMLVAFPAVAAVGAALAVVMLGMQNLQDAFRPVIHGFEDMVPVIGRVVSRGLTPLTEAFTVKALPVIQAGLARVAGVMNGFLKDFLTWAGSAPTVTLIGQVFDGIASAMKPLGGAATAFADAILRITKDAAPGLRTISGVIRSLALRFDNFIKSKDKDGSLTKTISDSVKSALDLVGALVRLGGAIGSLFAGIGKGSASTFTGAIQGMADAVDRFNQNGGGKAIHDFLVQVGQAIKDYFTSGQFQKTVKDLGEFAANAREIAGAVAGMIGGVKGIKGAFDSIPGSGALFGAVSDAIDPLGTVNELVNTMKTGIPDAWRTVSSATSSAWAAITGTISGAWTAIISGVSGAVGAVVSGVESAWAGLAGFMAATWAVITAAASGAWAAVTGAVSTAVGAVMGVVTATLGVVSAVWSAFWGSSFGQFVAAGFGLVESIFNLAGAVIEAIVKGLVLLVVGYVEIGWAGVQAVTGALVAFMTAAWGAVSSVTSTAWQAVSGFVSTAANAVWSVVSAAWGKVTSVTSTAWAAVSGVITGWWNTIAGTSNAKGSEIWSTVSSWFSRVASAIGGAFRDAYNSAVTWIGNLIAEVVGLGSRVASAVAGFGSLLFDAGAKLIQGLIDGITSKIRAVTDTINGLAGRIRGFFPGSPVREGPLTSWNNGGAGKRLVEMLAAGLSDTSGVESAMSSLAGKVSAPLEASAFAAGQGAAGGVAAGGVTVYVTNPVPETASESTTRIMRRLAVFGPAALPATA